MICRFLLFSISQRVSANYFDAKQIVSTQGSQGLLRDVKSECEY